MGTAAEGLGHPEAAGSDLLGPRFFLGHLVIQFTVPIHGKGKRSSMDSSPSLSSVALAEQSSLSAASLLLSLCAYTYLSQLNFILYRSNLSRWYWIIIPPVILSPIPVLHSSSSCSLSVSVLPPIASAASTLCAVHCRDYSRLSCLLCVQAISPRKWEYLYSLSDKHWPPPLYASYPFFSEVILAACQ